MKVLRAEIGVAILIGGAILFGIFKLIAFPFPMLIVLFTAFPLPFAFCIFAGMALYISDRKSFLNRRSGDEYAAVWLAILGLALIVESLIDGMFAISWMGWIRSISRSWTWEESMIRASYLAVYGLVFLFGVLLLFDYGKMVEDKRVYPPSAQRLNVETPAKYPRALFAKYAQQYPHNPEGVLEWHIHKKTKEGKTREQAIKELTHAY